MPRGAHPLSCHPGGLLPVPVGEKLPRASDGVTPETMSIQVERATIPCTVCATKVTELRRGRCWSCYTRWADARPVGRGAACQVCGDKRRENLRLLELHARSLPFCHNCAARTIKLENVPEAIDELRALLRRDRRNGDRRTGRADRRLFPRERRVGDRRAMGVRAPGDNDPAVFLPELVDLIIELDDHDIEVVEETVVRERPRAPGP